jgi:transposase, IS30 family
MSHLTLEQRYTIEVLRKENYSQTEIAKRLNRDKSVIFNELKRNSDQCNGVYKAELAHKKTLKRHREKNKIIYFTDEVKQYVDACILDDYSPEQIVGVARKQGLNCVSHERIYQYIWKDKKASGMLYKHLRTQGKTYRKRGAAKDKRGQIIGRVPMAERPEIVDKKERIGDLELDLIVGVEQSGYLLTINDRATSMSLISKLETKEAKEVQEAIVKMLLPWKSFLQTITSDNGKEFAYHHQVTKELDVDYYFARPYHSWERGANENMNGLIRQYFTKKMNFKNITNEDVEFVQNKLNNRPRKKFGYETPNEVFLQKLNQLPKVAFMY